MGRWSQKHTGRAAVTGLPILQAAALRMMGKETEKQARQTVGSDAQNDSTDEVKE